MNHTKTKSYKGLDLMTQQQLGNQKGDLIIAYKVESSVYTIMLLSLHHISAVKIIKRSGPKILPWGTPEQTVVNPL